MKTIHEQIQTLPQSVAGAYEANFFPLDIARHQAILRTLLADIDTITQAVSEGIFEVTIRTRSTTLTLPVDSAATGSEVGMLLFEELGNKADRMAGIIADQHRLLVTEGESQNRIKMLELLLAPVDAQGYPVRTTPALVGSACPLLPSPCICHPEAPTGRRSRAPKPTETAPKHP